MYTPDTARTKERSTAFLTSVIRLRVLLGAIVVLAIPVGLVDADSPSGTHAVTAAAAEKTGLMREGPVVDSTSALGPSVVSISGRQLIVRRRNPDGTLSTAAPYVIRGVDWSPVSRGTNTSKDDPNNANVRRPEFSIWAATDIPLMKAMNVNTVYTYIDPGLDANGTAVLDQLYANNIMVVMTVDDGINNAARVQQAVSFYKDHPAILAWMLGNEWNINRYFTNPQISAAEAAQRTETAAALIKTLDSNHPVATSYGDIDIPAFGMQLADTQNYVNNVCHSVDIWGLNVFRGNTFGTIFDQWQVLTSKPMFLGEFGTDAFRSVAPGSVSGSVDGIGQAHWDLSEWNHLVKNLSAQDPAKVAVGGFAFEWADEWWKVQPYGSQETNGFILVGGHPDDYASEEYFGIVDIDRNPRPLYYALKTAFEATYQPPQTVTFRAASRGSTAAEFSSQHGVALFFKDGQIFYRANGGAGDGRGFNVAAIDPCTNALLRPVQHFDSWSTRSSGTGLNEMMGFLDSLPNGTLILIAIADEAGLNQFPPNDCQHLNNPYSEAFFQKLEALGSHQIRSYCYWSSWAMVTVKGEGQSRGEQLTSGSEASAEGTQLRSAVLSPSGQSFGANGGSNSIGVSTQATCAWTAISDNSFVTVVPPGSGSGNGAVNYTVAANTDNIPRVTTLTIAGQPFVVSQSAPNQNLQITVQTNPSGRSFTVDGVTYTSTQTFTWPSGSSHGLVTSSPQSGGTGTQYLFSSWSDGGPISHTVSPTSNTTYAANFTTQYFLTMNADAGGTVSPASGYLNSGQTVPISASANSGFSFSGWTGSGSGSFTGSTNPGSVTMNGPITETGHFTQSGIARTLTVASSSPASGVGITVTPNDNNNQGSGTTQFTRTYNNNASVNLTAPSTASGNNFQKWQRDGSDWATSQSTNVTMDANHTMTAVYVIPCAGAQMTSPANGTSITTTTAFTWNTGTGIVEYWLQVGTTVGGGDIYSASQGTSTSRMLSNLPNGVIYVRLSSRCASTNAWSFNDYSYLVGCTSTAAQMTSPANGATISPSTTFTWNTGSNNSEYWLMVGTTPGGGNIYSSSQLSGTSRTLSNLPAGPIYVRLSSRCAGSNNWSFKDYTYTIVNCTSTAAQMTSPANAATIPPATTFTWNTGSNNSEYWLQVGTTAVGSNNLYSSSQLTGTSRALSNLPPGPIYVRLSSRCAGSNNWSHVDTTYTVVTCTAAQMTSPINGASIQSSTTFTWNTGTGNSEYWLQVGTTQGGSNIYSASQLTGTSRTVNNLLWGTIHVTLSSRCQSPNSWTAIQYSYSGPNDPRSQMISPGNGSILPSSIVTFNWTRGSGNSQNFLWVGNSQGSSEYFYDYINNGSTTVSPIPTDGRTIYVRLWSFPASGWTYLDYSYRACSNCGSNQLAQILTPANGATFGSSAPTFNWSLGTGNTQYFMWVGNSQGSSEHYYDYISGGSSTISGLPTDGRTIWVRIWSFNGQWVYIDYAYKASG